jgi:hypothetical protein
MKHRRQTSEAGMQVRARAETETKRYYVKAERMVRVIHLRLLPTALLLPTSEWPRDALAGGNDDRLL